VVQKSLPKVLRIGIVQDGKIAQERLIRSGEPVTVGESPRNTFVVAGTKLGQRAEVFVPRGSEYFLTVPEWVEGKISWKNGIRGMEELRKSGDMVRKGDAYQVLLNETVRGKISLGSVTLLFQFVPAPPEPIRTVTAADFRPRLFDEDDPLFLGLLGVFTVIATAIMAWVIWTPLPERLDLDLVQDASDLVVEKKIEQVQIEQPKLDAPAEEKKTEEKKPTEEKPAEAVEKAPVSAESVAKKSLALQMLGTYGDADGAAKDILGDGDAASRSLDEALNGVSGVETASQAGSGLKSGSAGGSADAKVGLDTTSGGQSGTGVAKVAVKKPKLDLGEADAEATSGDKGGIASVVRRSSGRVTTCVEAGLKKNPDLSGRVSVGWTIQNGRVTEAHLVTNNTGDKEVGDCIVRAVRGMHFADDLTAEVSEFPWAVSGQ
jgi:hypothetical protein